MYQTFLASFLLNIFFAIYHLSTHTHTHTPHRSNKNRISKSWNHNSIFVCIFGFRSSRWWYQCEICYVCLLKVQRERKCERRGGSEIEDELVKRQTFMFCHILRCDWWFTSYEWNANNSVRAHSNTTHWQAHRGFVLCCQFCEYVCVCANFYLLHVQSFVRSIVCCLRKSRRVLHPCEKGSVFARAHSHTHAFACARIFRLFFCNVERAYWMRS